MSQDVRPDASYAKANSRPHSILQYIIDEGLLGEDGEPVKLPPLDRLASELGVSRCGTIRTSLSGNCGMCVVYWRAACSPSRCRKTIDWPRR